MNNRGFTLTELLAVIAIISIISLIAVPNIINISESIKGDNMLNDAKRFISLAKARVNSDYDIRDFSNTDYCSSSVCTFYLIDLNKDGDFKMELYDGERKIVDVDGVGYEYDSRIEYRLSGNERKYCIFLRSAKRFLAPSNTSSPTCVDEELLTSRNVVHVYNDNFIPSHS